MERKMHGGANKLIYQNARELRNNATHAETILWRYLKTKPWGYKFRRQHPYSIYILDFYCHSLKLVIEADGNIHDLQEVKQNDAKREAALKKDGFQILRFRNERILTIPEIVFKEIENVIIKKKDDKIRQ